MTYEQMKDLKPGDFKRACGVHPQLFEKMLQVLRENVQRKIKPGRPAKLSNDTPILAGGSYLLPYRALMGSR